MSYFLVKFIIVETKIVLQFRISNKRENVYFNNIRRLLHKHDNNVHFNNIRRLFHTHETQKTSIKKSKDKETNKTEEGQKKKNMFLPYVSLQKQKSSCELFSSKIYNSVTIPYCKQKRECSFQ